MIRLEEREVLTSSVTYWACPRGRHMSRRSHTKSRGKWQSEEGAKEGGGRTRKVRREGTTMGSYLRTSKSQEDTKGEGEKKKIIDDMMMLRYSIVDAVG